jgi:hypothetical protein
MADKKIYITDLGHKHLFVEAHVPNELFIQLLEDFKKNGFHVIGLKVEN